MRRANVGRLALLAVLWGSSFLWIKLALRGFDPVQIVFVRLALGAAVLLAIAAARGLKLPRDARTWGHLFVAALVANAIPYVLFGIGERTTGSSVAGMLNATTPLWTVLIGLAAGTETALGTRRWAGVLLGFAGTLLIFSPWSTGDDIASWGGVAFLAAALSYGVSYVYMGRYLTGRGIPPIMLSASQLTAATLLLAVAIPIGGRSPIHWRYDAVIALVILGVFGTGIAYVLNYRLIEDEGPAAASTTTYLLPIVATILGAAVLSEPVTASMIGGMALILLGVGLAQRRPAKGGRAAVSSADATV